MNRWFALSLTIVPFACHASVDPVIVGWMGSAALVHLAAFAWWWMVTLRRRAPATSLGAFAGVCAMAWWAYLGSQANEPVMPSLALIAVPLMFIALEFASGALNGRFPQPATRRAAAQVANASRPIGRP